MGDKEEQSFPIEQIKHRIYFIRDVQVMLDRDLAEYYEVKPIRLREQIKRNIKRFPSDFMFQLTDKEVDFMVSQNAIPSRKHLGGHLPYVFTEQGVANISSVLTSDRAINVNIQIVRAFVAMRKFIGSNARFFQRTNQIELKQLTDKSEIDAKFERVFDAIEQKDISPKQGIIYNGQIFDAHVLASKIIRSAKKSIIIIDNYIDDNVLTLLTNRKKGVRAKIYTKSISKRLALDVKKFNEQYGQLDCGELKNIHDRFIIIDGKEMYHSGASLKDLGKKISALSKFEKESLKILEKLK